LTFLTVADFVGARAQAELSITPTIDYRRSSMNVDRPSAEVWASWFRALGDASRVLILNRLAVTRHPMTVGEVVAAVDVGQSTVSHHLKLLADTGFVLVERRGTASLYRVNERCLECFPSAAELVMGQLPRYGPLPAACAAPWDAGPKEPETTTGSARE
jgi:DNA-binding transcriptional ArsR family regulator